MRLKLLLAIFLISTTAKAVTFEQQCFVSDAGPTSSISCNLTDVEPARTFWIGVHYLEAGGAFINTMTFPSCLTTQGVPAKTTSIGHDMWWYQMRSMTGPIPACCTGTQTFGFGWNGPVTNVQMFVYQIQGIVPTTSGNFDTLFIAECAGTATQPSCHLINVNVGDFIASWVSTARGFGDNFTAGPGFTLLDAIGPDTTEWQIATSSGTVVMDFTGIAAGHWSMTPAAFAPGPNRPTYCGGAVPIIHRRNEY